MKLLSEEHEQDFRRQLRQQLLLTTPAHAVDEIVDLVVHAAASAIDAAETVCDGASDPRIAIAARGPAMSLLASHAQLYVDALRAFAQQHGMPAYNFKMQVGS